MQDNNVNQEIKELLSKKEHIEKEEIDRVIDLVKETNALKETKALKDKFIRKAYDALDNLSDGTYKDITKGLLQLL